MQDEVRILGLVQASRRGDQDAFRQLLDAHRDAITSTLVACGVRNTETAHDLAQETALRAWTRLESLRNPRAFSAWIRQIAANVTRDYVRRRAIQKEESLDSVPEIAAESDPLADLERRAEADEMRSILLQEDEDVVVLLVDRARGASNRSLAERMGISEDAMKMRIMRARKRLRRRLRRLREG